MNSMEISNFLDNLRSARKITQEEFVDGVVSMRQYQRYRSGECEITYETLDLFSNKLGIPTKKLLYEFERSKITQNLLINEFYNAVVNRDESLAAEIKTKIEKNNFFDDDRRLYYNHTLLVEKFYCGKLSKPEMVAQTSELVNFPVILKQKFFTDIEVLILSFLLSIIDIDDQKKLLKKMTILFENEEWIMADEGSYAYSLILMRMAQVYGIHKNLDEVLSFCDLGIKRNLEYKQFYLLEYFYYYKALAYFKLQSFTEYEDALFHCYNVLHTGGTKKRIERFTVLIEKDFRINFDAFIINYLKKKFV